MEDLLKEGTINNVHKFGQKPLNKQFKLMDVRFPSLMVKAQGVNRLRWDLIIISLAVYQAITIPISISYDPDIFNSHIIKSLDSLIDLVFIVDIILNFRTSYIDPNSGEEVLDPFMVATKYLTELRFYIDVLSTVPLDDFFGGGYLAL